jgi:hypothetical protein
MGSYSGRHRVAHQAPRTRWRRPAARRNALAAQSAGGLWRGRSNAPTRRHRKFIHRRLYDSSSDCTVLLPIGRYVGHAALDQVAGELRASHSSFVYTPHRPPQAVQDGGRLAWGSGPPGEPPRFTGSDVILPAMGRSLPYRSSSTRRPHSGGHPPTNNSPRPFPDRRAAHRVTTRLPCEANVWFRTAPPKCRQSENHPLWRYGDPSGYCWN